MKVIEVLQNNFKSSKKHNENSYKNVQRAD